MRAAADAAATQQPGTRVRILELGCGTGEFAARLIQGLPEATVVATDQSVRMVELTRVRGVEAQVADVMRLPFPDDAFDVVVALWMLYHVPDLATGLGEVRRVLRAGGTFVAATNGDEHLAGLLTAAGGRPLLTSFSSENGADALAPHFATVERHHHRSVAHFADSAQARAYLATFSPQLASQLPPFTGARTYAGASSVFVAR